MRTVSGAMTAAAASLASTPDVKLELADSGEHFTAVYTGASTGPCAACLAPDGSLIVAYVSGANVKATRITDPSMAAQWTAAYTSVTADGRESAGVALCNNGATVRLLFQRGSTTDIRYSDSFDNGVSWSAPATLFALGKTCYGIAMVDITFSTVFIAYDNSGGGTVRLAVWAFSGAWAGVDWTNGDLNTITGIDVVKDSLGNYGVVLAGQGVAGQPYSILSAVYNAGHVWSSVQTVRGLDLAFGILIRYPHLSVANGVYRLTYQEQDNGSSDGLVYVRVNRMTSVDFMHWTAPVASPQAGIGHGAVWLRHAIGDVLASADAALFSPAYNPATMYRDLTGDLIDLTVVEQEGSPGHLTVVLDNSMGVYTALAALKHHAQMQLSQGYVGVGLVPTHLLYVDGWTFERGADINQVTITATDASRLLERQTRYPVSYANRAVSYIVGDLTALAGFESAAIVDGSPQFSQNVARFQLPPGQTFLAALQRLLTAYEGTLCVRVVPGSGPAFAVVDQQLALGKSAGQAAVWSYDGEPEYVHLRQSGDRANHLIVYGPQSVPIAVAEAWDIADLVSSGQERYGLIVEQLADNAPAAESVATLAMARETRLATHLVLAVAPHPGLEIFDAIAVHDAVLPVTTGRITGLVLTHQPRTASHDLVITCEGI
jgi:hypothetical protein